MKPELKVVSSVKPIGVKNFRPHAEVVPDGRSFLEWAECIGVRVSGGNWIQSTLKGYERVMSSRPENIEKSYMKNFPVAGELQYNLIDFLNLADIRTYVGEQPLELLRIKLKEMISGPKSLLSETKDNSLSRNTAFELFMTAQFNKRGYTAVLSDPNPDVLVRRSAHSFPLECKRTHAKRGVKDLLKAANEQFFKATGNQGFPVNMVALDVTRAITEGKMHLTGDSLTAMDIVVARLDEVIQEIASDCMGHEYPQVDAFLIVYLDHVQPDISKPLSLNRIFQLSVLINPMSARSRRRMAERMLKPFEKEID